MERFMVLTWFSAKHSFTSSLDTPFTQPWPPIITKQSADKINYFTIKNKKPKILLDKKIKNRKFYLTYVIIGTVTFIAFSCGALDSHCAFERAHVRNTRLHWRLCQAQVEVWSLSVSNLLLNLDELRNRIIIPRFDRLTNKRQLLSQIK